MRLIVFLIATSGCIGSLLAGPPFCTRGFQIAARFHKCWEEATFVNKYPPLYEQHEYLDGKFVEDYATHMCSVVKPAALRCLRKEVAECSNAKKLMEIADKSGGACRRTRVNPFFKKHVLDNLVAVKSDSPCFDVTDNTYECYTLAGQKVMRTGDGAENNIATFHKVADKFFGAYWGCMVEVYKSNKKVCPHWQIPMLLTLQKTAMPSLYGLQLRPEQVETLELGNGTLEKELVARGPSKLFLLLELHDKKPELSGDQQDSIVLELDDLNDPHPHLQLEGLEEGNEGGAGHSLTLKEIKKMLREYRQRNQEVKQFVDQAKDSMKKHKGGKGKSPPKKTKKKLHRNSMIA